MSRLHSPVHRPGGSLGGMMLALDIDPEHVAEIWHGVPLARAIERCLACPVALQCAAWLRDANRQKDGYRTFCPNAGMLETARRR
jgi:hypothetical protein